MALNYFAHNIIKIHRSVRISQRWPLAQDRIQLMINVKFVVKVNRGSLAPAFVQRIDRTPIQMTTNRKLALMMGKLTAEDAITSIQTSSRIPELVPVQVTT